MYTRRLSLASLALLFCFFSAAAVKADVIAVWNFNDSSHRRSWTGNADHNRKSREHHVFTRNGFRSLYYTDWRSGRPGSRFSSGNKSSEQRNDSGNTRKHSGIRERGHLVGLAAERYWIQRRRDPGEFRWNDVSGV